MQRHVLPSAQPIAQLQPLQAIQPPHPLLVDQPALPAEQHVEAQIPEARTGLREVADPEAERPLILRATAPIPRVFHAAREKPARRQARTTET